MVARFRDLPAESQARMLLESFGAVQIELLEDHGVAPDSDADYLVLLEGDRHAHCAFTAYAVPQLKTLGWVVEVDDDYPYRVVEEAPPWYAVIQPDDEGADWFSFELGVEIEGGHLPARLGCRRPTLQPEGLKKCMSPHAELESLR